MGRCCFFLYIGSDFGGVPRWYRRPARNQVRAQIESMIHSTRDTGYDSRLFFPHVYIHIELFLETHMKRAGSCPLARVVSLVTFSRGAIGDRRNRRHLILRFPLFSLSWACSGYRINPSTIHLSIIIISDRLVSGGCVTPNESKNPTHPQQRRKVGPRRDRSASTISEDSDEKIGIY